MENQLEKHPMPKEEELLAILPESGTAGENGTRIIARRAAFWVPNCVSYVLRYYAAREGRTLALIKKAHFARIRGMVGRRKAGQNARRNLTVMLAPWLILVPTQVREPPRAARAAIGGAREVRAHPRKRHAHRIVLDGRAQ
ncbi:MAG: hypothetical protein ACFN4G_05010 [Mitsuokella sp.]